MKREPSRRAATLAAAAALLALALPLAPARAQERFPSKEIKILIGFPAGSAAEVTLRALVEAAAKYVPQPLVILNKPGASQALAMSDLTDASADGYTIAMTTDGFLALTVLQQKMRFNPDDISVLLGYAQFKHVLFTRADAPWARYDDFVAYAKKEPGGMDYGGTGVGSAPDLLGKMLAKDAGIPMTYVPFKGSNEYVPSVMGQHVKSAVIAVSGIAPQLKDGSLSAVLVFGDARLPQLPGVPSSDEKGIRNAELLNSVLLLVVPKKVPADRVKVLHDAFRKAAEDPDFRRAVEPTGLVVKYFSPRDVDDRIARAKELGTPLLRELKLLAN
jgi:tripartite-type tricarboxylate transporter receptor subunit TctC